MPPPSARHDAFARLLGIAATAAGALSACAGPSGDDTSVAAVEELRATPAFSALREPAQGASGLPLVISNNPEIFTSDGVLGGTLVAPDPTMRDTVTGQRLTRALVDGPSGAADASCPAGAVRGATVYLYHDNRSGSSKSVHVLVRGAGAPVNVTYEGVLNTRSLPRGENPFQIGNSVSVNTAQQFLGGAVRRGTVGAPADGVNQIGAVVVDRNSPVDGRYELRGDGCFFVQVVASSNAGSTTAARTHMADGEIRPPGEGRLGRASGLYAATDIFWNEAVSLSAEAPIWGYAFASQAQTLPATLHYADSDSDTNGNYGAVYRAQFQVTNDTGGCRLVRLRLAAYPGQKRPEEFSGSAPTRFWDGPAIFTNNSGQRLPLYLKTTPGAMQQPLQTAALGPGQTIRWGLDIPVPGLISIPGAFLFEQDPC
jgi:hypothetical protein